MACWLLACPVWAQDDPPAPTAPDIDQRIGALGSDDTLTAPQRQTKDLLLQARLALEAAAASRQAAEQWIQERRDAPALAAEIGEELSRAVEPFAPVMPPDATLDDLERELAQAEADLAAAQAELDRIAEERRSERARQIPDELASLATQIGSLRQQLTSNPPPDMPPEAAEARGLQLAAQLEATKAKVAELQAEGASLEARRELLPAKRDRAVRRVAAAEERVRAWLNLVDRRRRAEADAAALTAREADLERAEQIPELREIAADVRELVRDLRGSPAQSGEDSVIQRLASARADLAERSSTLRDLDAREANVRRRVAMTELDSSQGRFLRRELFSLEDARSLRRRLARYHSESDRAQVRLLELEELEAESSDVESALTRLQNELGPAAPADHAELAADLLSQRKALTRQALETYEPYVDTLDQLILMYERTITLTRELREFIEERIFWVRSIAGPLIPRPRHFVDDVRWLIEPGQWASASANTGAMLFPQIAAIDSEAGQTLLLLLAPSVALLLVLVSVMLHWRLRRISRRPLPTHGRLTDQTMSGTVWKLALAVAAALPDPLALWLISRWLTGAAEVGSAPAAVAASLGRCAFVLLALHLLNELAQPGAVGATHFRWPEPALAHIRRHLRWMTPVALAAVLTVGAFTERGEEHGADAMARVTFAAGMTVAYFFYRRMFSPKKPVIGEYIKKHRGGLAERAAWAWFPLLASLPIIFALAALAGYMYTALQIQRRVGDTFFFVLLVLIGNAIVLRWLQLARRKLAMEAAKARAAAAAAQAGQPEQPVENPKEAEAGPEIDIGSISQQSRDVLRAVVAVVLIVGLFGVWSGVLPALRWFERVQIFPSVRYVDPDVSAAPPVAAADDAQQPAQEGAPAGPAMPGQSILASGKATSEPAEASPLAQVTLADLGLAILLAMLTVSASKNVPGLLEVTVLQRLPLDAAGRYAYYTVARYLVIIVGVIAVASALSISWKHAQWLAAALTFGLAFGLQEIFANFASGIIILFEQPIRVGDTVTVGGVSGTVSRIRTRATTITDWDNKEIVIPNKIFITEQVVNWTLTDTSTRLIVPIGVDYGTDLAKALEILLRVARECPLVMTKPEPRALFLGFGESTLNLELRVFIATVDSMLPCRHDLHVRLERALREAGIQISFPQLDLHVRSLDERVAEVLSGRASDRRTREDVSS